MRRGTERPIAGAMAKLIDRIAPQDPLTRLTAAWPDVVGPAISAHSRPATIRSGRLTVECGSSVYAQELELLSRKVLIAVNGVIGEASVTALRCTVAKL